MSRGFSERERFWDQVTRERMKEVGEGRPFDLMVRGEYVDDLGDVRGVRLGGEDVSVEMDIVNFDLEDCFLRAYEIDLGSVAEGFSPGVGHGKARDFSGVINDLVNDWGYELGMIVFDAERDYGKNSGAMVDGTVYWPEGEDYMPDDAYRDVEKMLGTDVLSEL